MGAAFIGGALIFVLIMFILGPFLLIAGLNLLGFTVAYNFWTWLGAFLVMFCLRGSCSSSSSKD